MNTITPAEAAEDLEIISGHLARYAGQPSALADHLTAFHGIPAADLHAVLSGGDPASALTGRHEHLHTPALDAAKRALAEAQDATASQEEDEEEEPCKREEFLEDPITRAYGVGGEMVGLITCNCPRCREEQK